MLVLPWFERGAVVSPNNVAIRCGHRMVTYRELNDTADRIACGLREAGVVSGARVGVLLDRSPEMVAALIAIWKVGGAYIPFDAASPDQRMTFLLEDSAPSLVLSQRRFLNRLASAKARVVELEELLNRRNATVPVGAETVVSGDDLAYVIYTSGSTGQPKGVGVTHAGLANTIEMVGQDLSLGQEDIVLAWSTTAFDVSCLEMYLPLVCGARMELVAQEPTSGRSKLEQLRSSAATVMLGTPTMYRLLLEEGWEGDPRMQLIVGGEVLPLALARRLSSLCRVLWNQYGPTETSICATRERIDAGVEKVTIGRPLPNVVVHLLDRDLRRVPKGSIGEMFIGGAGVARGYLNRPELSGTRFLPDPFSREACGQMYRSGDLAVELADGRYDFIGRTDGQVKIRGFRVEMEEVESALRQCDGVEAAVVRAIELEPGDQRLVAFVISDRNNLAQRLRRFLGRQLPPYMIPSEFVRVRQFPVTRSGKVDLRALDAMRPIAAKIASRTNAFSVAPIEVRLGAIWRRLLKVRTVGVHEDFFALGGHSLLAARLLAEIEQRFGRKVPHSVFVESSTIHGLATYLRHSPRNHWPALITIRPGKDLRPLFLAHGIGGSLLSFVELAGELGLDRPVYGLQLPASIDQQEAELTVLASNYLRQIRAIQPCGPYHLAGHSSGGLMIFEIACQLREQGETVGLLALLDCDPDTGRVTQHGLGERNSWKASFQRMEFRVREYGAREMIRRRITHETMNLRRWLAEQSRRTRWLGSLAGAEGYLALALRGYEFKTYTGDATLFLAQDEPPARVNPKTAWRGRILGACEVRTVAGSHTSMLNRPQVRFLAQEIAQRIAVQEQVSSAVVLV